MKWLSVRIKTTVEAEDLIIGSLYLRGFEGAQIEDHIPLTPLEKEQMFVDILPDTGENDGTAYLTFYIEMDEEGRCVLGETSQDSYADNGEFEGYKSDQDQTTAQLTGLKSDSRYTVEEIRNIITEELGDLQYYDIDAGELTVEISETEDLDWINNWKKYFHQFTIDDILVIPSWEEVAPEDAGKKILHIDPGTAFGTGMHETTQLCIRQMRKYIESRDKDADADTDTAGEKSVGTATAKPAGSADNEADAGRAGDRSGIQLLDIGTGSGILGILALMFGASSVKATDLDPCAIAAVEDNLEANGIDKSRFELKIGNIIDDRQVQDWAGYGHYDIVMANILADVLVPLMPAAYAAVRPGGVIITSGIIEGKENIVKQAMEECGLEVTDISAQGEWRSVTGRRKGVKGDGSL